MAKIKLLNWEGLEYSTSIDLYDPDITFIKCNVEFGDEIITIKTETTTQVIDVNQYCKSNRNRRGTPDTNYGLQYVVYDKDSDVDIRDYWKNRVNSWTFV